MAIAPAQSYLEHGQKRSPAAGSARVVGVIPEA